MGGGTEELESVIYEEIISLPPLPPPSAPVGEGDYAVPSVPSPHTYTPVPAQRLASNGGGEGGEKVVGEIEEGVYEVLQGEQ